MSKAIAVFLNYFDMRNCMVKLFFVQVTCLCNYVTLPVST